MRRSVWSGTAAALVGATAVTVGQVGLARWRYGRSTFGVPAIDVTIQPTVRNGGNLRPVQMATFGDSGMAGVGVDDVYVSLPVQLARGSCRSARACGGFCSRRCTDHRCSEDAGSLGRPAL